VNVEFEAPSRRFLHICYCCEDTDAVVNFYVNVLDMKEVMRNPLHPSDGSLLGIDGEIVSGAAFVYDKRGPRTSASLEVQEWVSPKMIGAPITDASRVGMQAVGFGVPDIEAMINRMVAAGSQLVSRSSSPWVKNWATLTDPFGTQVDLMQDETIPVGESRLRHLRITVTNIDDSLSWYRGMGFLDVAEHVLDNGDFVGLKSADGSAAVGRVRRMKLPDEAAEIVLTDWSNPKSHGQHPADANHAGLFRTAVGVDDTVASYERFLAEGWKFEREPRQVELEGTAVPDMWICFLNDPDGVPFEFVQRPRSAFRPERV
jgi:catechol 2,3-dioxygenase-like lactoylglutathione lyase family enzyme